MKKMVLTLVAGVSFVLAAFNLFGQERAEVPVYKDGDSWVFRSDVGGPNPVLSSDNPIGDYLITYSDKEVKVFKISGNQKEEVSRGVVWLQNMLVSGNKSEFLKFPIFVGVKWKTSYQIPVTGRLPWISAETTVTGIEVVTTPAGTFRALKIERRDMGSFKIDWKRTYFYSAQTGSIVRMHHETAAGEIRDVELIKFAVSR